MDSFISSRQEAILPELPVPNFTLLAASHTTFPKADRYWLDGYRIQKETRRIAVALFDRSIAVTSRI